MDKKDFYIEDRGLDCWLEKLRNFTVSVTSPQVSLFVDEYGDINLTGLCKKCSLQTRLGGNCYMNSSPNKEIVKNVLGYTWEFSIEPLQHLVNSLHENIFIREYEFFKVPEEKRKNCDLLFELSSVAVFFGKDFLDFTIFYDYDGTSQIDLRIPAKVKKVEDEEEEV